MLRYCHASNSNGDTAWDILILRYFNPIVAHGSGIMGEDPRGLPNYLMSLMVHVCVVRKGILIVFGDDYDIPNRIGEYFYYYQNPRFFVSLSLFLLSPSFARSCTPTPSLTPIGVRDYIHVVDITKQYFPALEKLYTLQLGCEAINLGMGKCFSVLELVESIVEVTGKPVLYVVTPQRPRDVAVVWAYPRKAREVLGICQA